MPHKAGFVNIIGFPNSGKSTLMNELLGEKISIVTSKEQTTRHRILGMLNGEDYQIVFSDTPGILEPGYKLQETMMKAVTGAIRDADHLLVLIDLTDKKNFDETLIGKFRKSKFPLTVLLNKIDLASEEHVRDQFDSWKKQLPNAEILAISALHKHGIEALKQRITSLLPESPPYFPKDQLTDRSERFIVSEIIRKQIYLLTEQEIPYSTEVAVESFKDAKDLLKINAVIYVIRESQKAIVIGNGGKMIKAIGSSARRDIEQFFQKKVFLELFVKVDKDWRTKEARLKRYGYLN